MMSCTKRRVPSSCRPARHQHLTCSENCELVILERHGLWIYWRNTRESEHLTARNQEWYSEPLGTIHRLKKRKCRDQGNCNRTYAFRHFLSFPRRRESSIWPFFNALDSRSPPSRGQASRE